MSKLKPNRIVIKGNALVIKFHFLSKALLVLQLCPSTA